MTTPNTPDYRVCVWITAAQTRFKNMYDAGKDINGFPAIQKAIKHLESTGKLTVGQVQYIWNRSSPNGSIPKYNTFMGYDKKYGDIPNVSLKDLIDSDLVDWASGRNSMQPALAAAIARETDYKWQGNKLVKKPRTMASGLFV